MLYALQNLIYDRERLEVYDQEKAIMNSRDGWPKTITTQNAARKPKPNEYEALEIRYVLTEFGLSFRQHASIKTKLTPET